MLRGYSWVWVTAVILTAFATNALAQDSTKGATKKAEVPATKAASAPATKAAAPAAADDEADPTSADNGVKQDASQIFKDPRVEEILENKFPELPYPPARSLTEADRTSLKNMAAGLAAPDRALLIRAVDIAAADITNKTNIRYVIDPPATAKATPNAAPFRAIEKASQSLIELLQIAKEKKNEEFLKVYVPILYTKLPGLLNGHLFARLQASIILAMSATPASLELWTKEINNPKQVVWVKLWAARGLSTATSNGKGGALDIVKATAATNALVNFFKKEQDAPWPVKIRVLEALGNIHLASITGPTGKPEAPAAIMALLSDKEERFEVRAWAAWSLGMITIPNSQGGYNFGLEGYHIGRLAAELGEKIGSEADANESNFTKRSDYARHLTGLLLYQVIPSLSGESDVLNSGLLNSRHPGIARVQPFLKGLDDQLKSLSRDCVDMLKAGGNDVKKARGKVGQRVAELNAFLDKNRPTETMIYPGGPQFPITSDSKVAGDKPAGK
jgi:hypothetical protein